MPTHPRDELTFLMIKPDGVERGLIGEVMRRMEAIRLKIIGLKMHHATREQIDIFYPKDEKWITKLGEKTLATYEKYGYDPIKELGTNKPNEIGQTVREWLLDYITSAPVVTMVISGMHAVDKVRKLAGDTMPVNAAFGTIRGDFSADSAAVANRERRAVFNLVHASESQEDAEREIQFWFNEDELKDW